jgi:outer membrane receptor protein involved in Fe transport
MRPVRFKPLALSAIALMAAQAAPTWAVIEEIIITANKRGENLSEVGMSVAALSSQQIKDKGITSLGDFAAAVPGLIFTPSETNTPIFTLRGVGFNESSLGVYPATSLYIDQAPLPFPALASHVAFDLERVEVLKGPQGTLFGQNSTGGAINFIAAKPTAELAYGGDISFGRFDRVETNGYVSGPLSDNLRARLAFTTANADEWQSSSTRDDENGKEKYYALRLLTEWEPTDTARFNFNVSTWKDKSDPQAQQLIAVTPGVPAFTRPQSLDVPFSPEESRAADWSTTECTEALPGDDCTGNYAPRSDREFYQAVARGDFDLSDDLTLTAMLSYADFEQDQATDGDGTYLVTAELDKGLGEITTFSAEVRLANSPDSAIRWIVGGNYESSETFEDQNLRYWDNTNYNPANLYINGSGYTVDQDIESYAVFGNLEFDLGDIVTLRAGARYTDTTIDDETCSYAPGDERVADLFNLLGTLDFINPDGNAFVPIGGFPDCFSLNDDNVPGEIFAESLQEDNVSWKIGADFHVTDDSLVYVNISQGYKAGSFPALSVAKWEGMKPVTQESVLSYELGVKSLLAEGMVQVNAAVFYNDYEDKQVRGKLLDPIFGSLDKLFNVPESEIFGAEMAVTVSPTDALTLSAAVTYLDSEVTKFSGSNAYGIIENFAGDPLPFTPEWTYTLDADYRFLLKSGGEVFFGATLTGQSDSDAVFGASHISVEETAAQKGVAPGTYRALTDNPFVIDEYYTVDARIGYQSADEHWKVMVFGKNVTDEYYWTTVITSFDSAGRFAGKPATYGIKVSYDF